MDVRVVTLRYSNERGGFDDAALREAIGGREVLSEEHHFSEVGNVPHITFVLHLVGYGRGGYRSGYGGSDGTLDKGSAKAKALEEKMPEATKKAYNDLKKWRNDEIKSTGKPSYEIARNHQLAEIALRAPKTMAALKSIKGLGDSFCKAYGEKVLGLVKDVAPVAAEGGAEHDGGEPDGDAGLTGGAGVPPAQMEEGDSLVNGRDARSPSQLVSASEDGELPF